MSKLIFQTKEEWLASKQGLRMIEQAQEMLENAEDTLEFDIEMGAENDVSYSYPPLGDRFSLNAYEVIEACLAFSSWAITVQEKEWKHNGNVFDIIWNIAKTGKCHIFTAFRWVMAGTTYKGEDYMLNFTPWWP